jgi:hypothetical protein
MLGCDAAPIYTDGSSRAAIGSVPDRSKWTARGNLKDAGNGVDGNINTLAVAVDGAANSSLMIDLGKPGLLNMVVVDHGRNEFGFARRMLVSTSLDGERFTQRHSGPGTRRVSTMMLITPVLARYVRLDVLLPGDRPFTVAEVYMQ